MHSHKYCQGVKFLQEICQGRAQETWQGNEGQNLLQMAWGNNKGIPYHMCDCASSHNIFGKILQLLVGMFNDYHSYLGFLGTMHSVLEVCNLFLLYLVTSLQYARRQPNWSFLFCHYSTNNDGLSLLVDSCKPCKQLNKIWFSVVRSTWILSIAQTGSPFLFLKKLLQNLCSFSRVSGYWHEYFSSNKYSIFVATWEETIVGLHVLSPFVYHDKKYRACFLDLGFRIIRMRPGSVTYVCMIHSLCDYKQLTYGCNLFNHDDHESSFESKSNNARIRHDHLHSLKELSFESDWWESLLACNSLGGSNDSICRSSTRHDIHCF